MEIGTYIAIGIAGYLLGSFPTAYLVVKCFTGKNILEHGTGNVGTMNTHRTTNSKVLTLLALVGDVLKGGIALLLGLYVAHALGFDAQVGAALGGILAVAGHNYSMFLKFEGGKGLATSAATLLYFAPPLGAVWTGVFFLTVALTKLMVLGQILATVVTPIVAHIIFPDVAPIIDALAFLVFVRHAPRLKNVIKGTEPSLYYKVRPPDGQ